MMLYFYNRSHDLFTFIFKHHPSSNTDANVASLSNSTSSQLVEGAKWEIINLKGQYSDVSSLHKTNFFNDTYKMSMCSIKYFVYMFST